MILLCQPSSPPGQETMIRRVLLLERAFDLMSSQSKAGVTTPLDPWSK